MLRLARWTGYAIITAVGLYMLGILLEDVTLPGLPEFRVYPIVVALALAGLGYLAYVAASNNVAAWGWPRAIVVLAVIGLVGYVLWEYRKGAANESYASGGSASVSGVNTDGLENLGTFKVPPPGIPQRGSPGATSWDPSRPPMAAEPKAPAFVASATLDDGKPFAGDLSLARWCHMCASGRLRQKDYDRLQCDPTRCQ